MQPIHDRMTTFLEPRDYDEYLAPSERPPVHRDPHQQPASESVRQPMTKRLKQSAGLFMLRGTDDVYEVFLVHPGGPYWSKKDEGAWTLAEG
jgi:hypothetical protein